ncbi:MAG: flagellar protein FliT [Acidovorax sp.]|jgi:flagellar protein FliT|nr:flagellar protein FliT [Acidovorax sp.]MDR3002728.1 flagellar protein FliT [Acidovorax sp.]
MEMQLLDYYKAIEAKSADMLQAALQHNWDAVVDCEKACGVLINELRLQAEVNELSGLERKEKTRIMQRILRNDAQIRVLAEPWLAQLDHLGKMPSSAVH